MPFHISPNYLLAAEYSLFYIKNIRLAFPIVKKSTSWNEPGLGRPKDPEWSEIDPNTQVLDNHAIQ